MNIPWQHWVIIGWFATAILIKLFDIKKEKTYTSLNVTVYVTAIIVGLIVWGHAT